MTGDAGISSTSSVWGERRAGRGPQGRRESKRLGVRLRRRSRARDVFRFGRAHARAKLRPLPSRVNANRTRSRESALTRLINRTGWFPCHSSIPQSDRALEAIPQQPRRFQPHGARAEKQRSLSYRPGFAALRRARSSGAVSTRHSPRARPLSRSGPMEMRSSLRTLKPRRARPYTFF